MSDDEIRSRVSQPHILDNSLSDHNTQKGFRQSEKIGSQVLASQGQAQFGDRS
jgi:hypothetical protein